MAKVLVLPDHIASQIAAGEVVERPASVVKELVENAIDSGAGQIEIAISADCRDIRVADNGCGMEADDAILAFHRHATSKLSTVDDLWKLSTLGFRGEALPSIASVSRMTCLTRTHESESGSRIEAYDGKVVSIETGCAPGTVMEINELFYNVPARLSFLKKASTEFGHIHEIVQSLAIAYPHIAFHLLNAGGTSLKTSGSGDLALAIVEAGLFTGNEALCEVNYDDPRSNIKVTGFVARPLHFRGDRKGIMAFVNKRPVRCPLTFKALDYAYSDLIPKGRYPLAVVTVGIQPEQVDVNIHPTKKEIKYSNSNEAYMSIQRAIVGTLRRLRHEEHAAQVADDEQRLAEGGFGQAGLSGDAGVTYGGEPAAVSMFVAEPSADAESPRSLFVTDQMEPAALRTPGSSSRISAEQMDFRDHLTYTPPARPSRSDYSRRGVGEALERQEPGFESERQLAAYRLPPEWRLIGYLHNTYILLETARGLMVVEQHIAHERTLYERVLAGQDVPGRITDNAQRLIVSAPLGLNTEQTALLRQHAGLLQSFGFDFEFADNGAIECTQVPLEMAHKDYGAVVQELLSQIAIADGAELELEASKSIACQAAIKNGMPLSEAAIIQLLCQWHETPRNDTCPHGRPVCLHFSMDKLFQLFHPA